MFSIVPTKFNNMTLGLLLDKIRFACLFMFTFEF